MPSLEWPELGTDKACNGVSLNYDINGSVEMLVRWQGLGGAYAIRIVLHAMACIRNPAQWRDWRIAGSSTPRGYAGLGGELFKLEKGPTAMTPCKFENDLIEDEIDEIFAL